MTMTEPRSAPLEVAPDATRTSHRHPTPPRPPRRATTPIAILEQEQLLFEQRLCEDIYGVAIRKINQYGKANLRYVKCLSIEEAEANRSVSSAKSKNSNSGRCLTWGKKKDTYVPLERFVAVRKGKHTERAKKNAAPANRILSLITNDPVSPSLDIEAPTQMDRDKFARAFAKFLQIPLEENTTTTKVTNTVPETNNGHTPSQQSVSSADETPHNSSNYTSSAGAAILSVVPANDPDVHNDTNSDVSSLTGHGYDAELVEELHHALQELRAELDEAREEAARAVKVAEQAIQSAEKSNSVEWQNTVTHQAAQAAAMAQKRSAEAIAKQRIAEDKLETEKKNALQWKTQATQAEEQASALQTRASAAEVNRAIVEEKAESERRMLLAQMEALRNRYLTSGMDQKSALEAAMQRNRLLEIELDNARKLMEQKDTEENNENAAETHSRRKRIGFGRKKRSSVSDGEYKTLLSGNVVSSSDNSAEPVPATDAVTSPEKLYQLHKEALHLRTQFELLRRVTAGELQSLPTATKAWGEQIVTALAASNTEIDTLRSKLAAESASRRKLLNEVQDLRGVVRVYCRPRPSTKKDALYTILSNETIKVQTKSGPTSFEFDRILDPVTPQRDLYAEFEDVCISALDGYNVCIMAYGQTNTGKTRTLLGDVSYPSSDQVKIENRGLQLQAMERLFSIARHRNERYHDVFTLSIVEVYNERLSDMIAGTLTAESRGQLILIDQKGRSRSQKSPEAETSPGKAARLEIRTDLHGETVVEGAYQVEVRSYEEVLQLWEEVLLLRRQRLLDQQVDVRQHEASSHLIATLKVTSSNISTGFGSVGRLQFVDLAGADLQSDSEFAQRSLDTLNEVITARSEYNRTVPYRNSTLTHLLRDSLEADTKVVLIACISSLAQDNDETLHTLRFAANMRRVTIGKATKHNVSPP